MFPQIVKGLNTGPRKKLLVIHLNGLVAHTFFDFEKVQVPKGRRPDGIYGKGGLPDGTFGKKIVFKRPFCDEFLKFCSERFEVGIWSAAKEWVNNLFNFIYGFVDITKILVFFFILF